MLGLPTDSDGLGWIVSRGPLRILLIPNIHPASITAAAAGDVQALAYIRFTAQHHAAFPDGCSFTPWDKACHEAHKTGSRAEYDNFRENLKKSDPQLGSVFDARSTSTRLMLLEAAVEGQLAAIKWIHAICLRTDLQSQTLIQYAAAAGQLEVLKYMCVQPRTQLSHAQQNIAIPRQAAEHLNCIKWLLSNHLSLDLYDFDFDVLLHVVESHGLATLQWCRESCEIPDSMWTENLLIHAAARADQPMLEWLRSLDPPVPCSPAVCRAAARHSNVSMLAWLRSLEPPCPWDATVTAAAASSGNMEALQWLRACNPPCPWGPSTCEGAAAAGRLDILMWLRGQTPPCPWDESCTEGAASQPNLEVLKWLQANGCPFGEHVTPMASSCRNLPMLEWLRSEGYSLHPSCLLHAMQQGGGMPMLEWLCEHGCIPTGDLYHSIYLVPRVHQSQMLKLLHRRGVLLPGELSDLLKWPLYDLAQPSLMFLADNGVQLPERQRKQVAQARQAHCTFHGLVRWCRQAVSDPSRGAHRAFDSMARDSSGQVLLSRLCMLPPELLDKIALAAELQHDIFSP